jgi:hypothetical protein
MYFKVKMGQINQSTLKFMDKQMNSTHCIYFLGETLDSTLSWQGHITKVITKLNSACFALRTLKLFLTIKDLRMVYFACVRFVIMYSLPFWENAVNSNNVFITQRRIIRAILNVSPKISCQGLFRRLNILHVLLAVVGRKKKGSKFVINNETYRINTRQSTNLYLPLENSPKCKTGAYYMGIKIYNQLPWDIR